jgi:hypothetical protein
VKPNLPTVTLVCIDCTDKVHLAERAIDKSLEQCNFGQVKLLTNDMTRRHAVQINPLRTIEEYSAFVIRKLHRYIDTRHCLIIQSDGYVINGNAWTNEFLSFDYIGAPWVQWKIVGNGGFSLRSKKLLEVTAHHATFTNPHPEDAWICYAHRKALEDKGIRFGTLPLAELFAFEGREYNGKTWQGANYFLPNTFGFHSWLTPLPDEIDRPLIFHHSGDMGDVIYGLATMKALGGGVLFVSPDNKHPYPRPTRVTPDQAWADNFLGLVRQQEYVWAAHYTQAMPPNVDVDLNEHRKLYRTGGAQMWATLFRLHLNAFGVDYPENKPWLTVNDPVRVPRKPIVVNRTARYRNEDFPWVELIKLYGHLMVFVGTQDEHLNFNGLAVPHYNIPFLPTNSLTDAARVIAGSKVFIGNQSACMAVALGLNKPAIQEVWSGNPNCILKRDLLYCARGNFDVSWVKKWL